MDHTFIDNTKRHAMGAMEASLLTIWISGCFKPLRVKFACFPCVGARASP